LINVGKVLRSQGRDGELKLRFYQEGAIELSGLDRLSVGREGAAREFRVESLSLRGKVLYVKLQGVDSKASADRLVGLDVFIPEDKLRQTEEGKFFLFQLIGCQVLTLEGERIGPVVDVLSAGVTETLVVDRGGKEVLIPFHASVCPGVDVVRREIRINPPAGLLDLNEI
jgi:16S rRNA processing protein RimM